MINIISYFSSTRSSHVSENGRVFGRNTKVSIPGWTIVDGMFGLNKHVSYQIVYRYWDNGNINKILINKRYADFYQFHQSLIRKCGKDIVLYLPPKQRKGRFVPRFIECRRERLQLYLSRMAITNPNEFMDFLGHNETNRIKVESDDGPSIVNQNMIHNGSAVPTRSCLAINTTVRYQKKQVKFEKEVVNNEKASRNPKVKKHVSRYENTFYYI
ncbi:hypothetical protein Glove_30g43 [Diversispora epigaea]|uniref:PX domain-containing protein n=1 Tax=Diversispora epigaea TaxID=1348612 RepID=A0A397JLT4_9GLOM|nr:hypothetical protein Glove_30g43 [Diversispora epigaea]